MGRTVSLLDCTLRDGGYVNDWDFGHSVITGTYKRLDLAGVEYIEVGFLDERKKFNYNRSIMPNIEAVNHIYKNVTKRNAIPVAMIDYGTCSIEQIREKSNSFIEGIRVIFKKEKIDEALPFCNKIKEKGYKLFVQAISITSYSDLELLQYVQRINEIKPYAFSIVDTYGLLDKEQLTRYFYLIDNNLDPEIKIGYHSHNNFQLGFSNTIALLSIASKRDIIVDSTVYGMGKSAGNCATELLAMYLNDHYEKQYKLNLILEIIDTDLLAIYQKKYWGYRYDFYISALNDCHPQYVQFLLNKKTLSITAANQILSDIPVEKKLVYDEGYITQRYIDYQRNTINDYGVYEILKGQLNNRKILLLGPGPKILKEKERIMNYIKQTESVVFAVNFMPGNLYQIDYVFISNAKRYSKFEDLLSGEKNNAKLIATSNIEEGDYPISYKLNYESLLTKGAENYDSSLILLLNALIKCNVRNVVLAGFDGFAVGEENYYDRGYAFVSDEIKREEQNKAMSKVLSLLQNKINISFLTDSIYQNCKK